MANVKPHVVYVADRIENAHLFQEVLSSLGAEVNAGSSLQISRLLTSGKRVALFIFDGVEADDDRIRSLFHALEKAQVGAVLMILRESQLPAFAPPEGMLADFVLDGAGVAECRARTALLLREGEARGLGDVIRVDDMEINLATYQVTIAGKPVDLTYLEYSLLTFLITHPGQTYSRDELLQHVWGIDYFGGSRTVDVHVRRVRSKLGPELAQRLETVRGVGYLWRM